MLTVVLVLIDEALLVNIYRTSRLGSILSRSRETRSGDEERSD